MSIELRPLSELNQHATTILVREIGLVDTLRFLSQFSAGSGDYTKERGQWLDELSLKQITLEIKARGHQRA
jgi:hypothetical protein